MNGLEPRREVCAGGSFIWELLACTLHLTPRASRERMQLQDGSLHSAGAAGEVGGSSN